MPTDQEFEDLKKLVDALAQRIESLTSSVQSISSKTDAFETWRRTHSASFSALEASFNDTTTTLNNTNAALAKSISDEVIARTAEQQELRALAETRNKDALLLANLALFYGIMAQEWRIARERVVTVTSSSTALQTLSAVGKYSLVFLLTTAVGVAGSLAGGMLAHLIDGPLVSLAGKLGYDEADARKAMDEKGAEAMKEGFSHSLTGLLMFLGHRRKDAAAGVTDPLEFFLDLEVQLREFALMIAQANKQGPGAWNRSEVKNPLAAAGTKATKASGLVGFANDSNLSGFAADPFWTFLFEAEASKHKERWAVVRSMLAVAMRRLAWSLYCRSQWRNLTWDYTVKVNSTYVGPKGEAADWKTAPLEEWSYKAWSSNMGWPAHFTDSIVPDFAGWEHDPDHPAHSIPNSNADVALATKLQKRVAHFSLAVYMCCQVRPERWNDAINPMADGAAELLKKYVERGSLDDNYAKFRAMRAEVNIVEVRFGDARIGSTSGKKGRMTGPAPFAQPYKLAISPKAITVVVTSTGRTFRKAHIRLLGPFEPGAVEPQGLSEPTLPAETNVVATATESLSLTAGGTHDWHGLKLGGGKLYCVVLEARAESARTGAATYARDAWFFRTPV
jgi:hypothetical protein